MQKSIKYNFNNIPTYKPRQSNQITKVKIGAGDSFKKSANSPSFKGHFVKNAGDKISEFFKKPFKDPYKVLDLFDNFGIMEYRTLTVRNKSILNKKSPIENVDIEKTLFLYKIMKKNLVEKFPKGFTLVSIGRSPAVLAKTAEAQGFDVKFCPISQLRSDKFLDTVKKEYVNKYAEFLETIGITKKAVDESKKPFVFIDYTYNGTSLKNFQRLLARDEIGVKGHNAVFLSLNNDLLVSPKIKELSKLIDGYFCHPSMKKYSPVKKTYNSDVLAGNVANLKMSDLAKWMQFHLIDRLEK